ncbi:kelch-like protein 10 [Uloborus diversus]|uniref:kelch-like protein 10 n=1 Tax=Uloborus diversus TaxID=327109 RepID=UPI0024097702|nr:kelch-like protein 10 [Uloborus diversus]
MDSADLSLSEDKNLRICIDSVKEWEGTSEGRDAVLQSSDGGSFHVHRGVVSMCSPYFRVLFTTKIGDSSRRRITIPGVSGPMLNEILMFAYTGQIEITTKNVQEMLPVADQFNVIGILKACSNFIRHYMTTENCIGIRNFARIFFCFELEEAANRFIMSNFMDIMEQSEEFLRLQAEELLELLSMNRLNVRKEELVWEAGIKWVDFDPENRKQNVSNIMRTVRLGLMDTQYFMEQVKQHRYVDNNDSCKPIVRETLRFLWDLEIIATKEEVVETPFLATPRIPYSILFTVGGWSGGSPITLIETYDTKADRWIQVPEVDPKGPRAYHKLAVIGHDIYVIGGFNGNDYFNSCRCFNAVTKKWREIAHMHTKRCYVSVAVLEGYIYAMGGYDGHHRQNTVERYDYRTNQWSWVTPMNVQRSDACATTLNGQIYIVGGFNGTECLQSGEFYNPIIDQWTEIPSMVHRRSGVSVIGHHGRIYALGGYNGISRLISAETFEPGAAQWTPMADMLHPRSNFAVEVMDDMIFVIGGFNGTTTIFHVECFDDRTNEWYEATDMNVSRSALAACVIPGLPDVSSYIHQNRSGLMEEKRQKLKQQSLESSRARYVPLGEIEEDDDNDMTIII